MTVSRTTTGTGTAGGGEGLSREILVLAGVVILSLLAGAGAQGGAGPLAGAFGTTFWVAAGLIALALLPVLLLPRPRRTDDANANADSGAIAADEQAKAA